MKVAVLNYCGTVGKTTIAAHLLAPRIPSARIYAVETINETAGDLGLDIEKMKGEKFGKLFKDLMVAESAIIDVGASNVEDFIDQMVKFEESHVEFDYFVVPVTSGGKEQKETLKTIQALAGVGIPAERIRIVFNRVDTEVMEEFAPILGYAKQSKAFIANQEAAIYENEVFNLLSAKKTTIAAVLNDETDYRAALKTLDREADKKKIAHYTDMHAIKSLAKGVNRQLDTVFAALFK
jgi:hypothetical protein